jgi:SnoaL-like domain
MSSQPSDRELIVDVMTSYARGVDTQDWERLRSAVFTPDARLYNAGLGDPVEPYQDEGERYLRASLGALDAIQHLIGNHSIEVAGDDATARCDVLVTNVNNDWAGGNTAWMGGVYDVTLKRVADGWRIATMALDVVWSGGNIAAAMGAAEAPATPD